VVSPQQNTLQWHQTNQRLCCFRNALPCRQPAPQGKQSSSSQPAAPVQQQQHRGGSKQPNLKELIKQSKTAKKRWVQVDLTWLCTPAAVTMTAAAGAPNPHKGCCFVVFAAFLCWLGLSVMLQKHVMLRLPGAKVHLH
jgi:Flp pilus assembly protein TadB